MARSIGVKQRAPVAERLAARERQQDTVARFAREAWRATDLQGFLDQAAQAVRESVDGDLCAILELRSGRDGLLLRAGAGWNAGLVGTAVVEAGLDTDAGAALGAPERVIVDDITGANRHSPPRLLRDQGAVTGVSSAIVLADDVYGILSAHRRTPRPFLPEDANFVETMARIIGWAIYRQGARAHLVLERCIGAALTQAPSPRDALIRVLRCFIGEMRLDTGEFWQPQPDGSRVRRILQVAPMLGAYPAGLDVYPHPDTGGGRRPMPDLQVPVMFADECLGHIALSPPRRAFAAGELQESLERLGHLIGHGITRIRAEHRARHLAAIAESTADAIIICDPDGTVTDWLAGAERLYGYTAHDMLGGSIDRLLPPEARQRAAASLRLRGSEAGIETTTVRKDGTRVAVSVTARPLIDESGTVVGVASAHRDVTRLHEAEREAAAARRQIEHGLTILGHELRNPLAAIRSASDLFQAHATAAPELRQARQILDRQSRHLANLIDHVLDYTGATADQEDLQREPVDLAQLCREATRDVQDRALARGLRLHLDIPTQPIRIDGDRSRLARILDQLLSNALDHTPRGGAVTIRLSRDHQDARVTVTDTGAGIDPELLPRVFEAFRQGPQDPDRPLGGLGLGLPLSKSLAELHGGSLEARNAGSGQGAEFELRLPLIEPGLRRGAEPRPRRLDILIVEDNRDAGQALRNLLDNLGHHAVLSGDGADALLAARSHPPDVVLCDLGLPGGVSGFDVAEQLRSQPATRDSLIIAVSGYGRPADKAQARRAGFDLHLTKPVDIERLADHLQAYLGRHRRSPTAT